MADQAPYRKGANHLEPTRTGTIKTALHEVKQKYLTQKEQGPHHWVTSCHIGRLVLARHERGTGAIDHALRGRPSNRKLAAWFKGTALRNQTFLIWRTTYLIDHTETIGKR